MIETFLMERMQSTYENFVDFDLSESGVRPVTLREMVNFGFDLDALMDAPLGYSQSNGTIELRDAHRRDVSGRDDQPRRGHERNIRGQLHPRAHAAARGR